MKKVININFQGRVVPIEETAYDILKQYVEALRRFFANEEGKEEIINDIESRIAELFAETLKKGSTCITDVDVNNIIASMGRPEDFESEEENVKSQLGSEQKRQEQSYQQTNSQQSFNSGEPRKLYRDENHKVLGGVCSGIANYFGIDRVIIRIIAVFVSSVFFIPYIIFWIAVPSSATQVIGSTRKRLFRDMDDKILAGVASGLGHYFGVKAWIVRLIFLLPFLSFVARWGHWGFFGFPDFLRFSFSPGATIIYIILWLILPEAVTAADKLEMKGQPVDLNSIKQTIQTDMEGFGGRAKKFGEEIKERAEEISKEFSPKAKQFSNEAAYVARRSSGGLGGFIALIAKIFAYFILGCVLFSIVATLFGIGVACFGLLPVKDFIINDGWQDVFAWGTLLLFIWVPVIGIITWIIRKLVKAKRNSTLLRGTFIALWIVGWFCFISLLASISRDFKYTSTANEEVVKLSNAKVNKLEVSLSGYNKYYKNRKHWLEIEPFNGMLDDTAYVPNTRIKLIRSNTDSFQVTVTRLSQGRTKAQANELAEKITYSIEQKDSILSLYKGIPINNTDKFRNQKILITIAVPVGKRILIDDKIGWMHDVHVGFNNDDNWSRDFYSDEDFDWETGKEYIMTDKGLKHIANSKYNYDNDKSNDDDKSPEELKRELDEKQHELDEQRKQLDKDVQDKLKKIDEDKRKLEKTIDSTKGYRYQKTASLIKPNIKAIDNSDDIIGDDNMRPSILSSYKIAG
ncbi:PspC domain-containing protein [Parasediminibacterium paludis]|uniref:PspC domain-containing protein n=1 Tax=Parasediminibacterium paludis TaxID=908966 RepID=A0ABV8Q3K6_9BACT